MRKNGEDQFPRTTRKIELAQLDNDRLRIQSSARHWAQFGGATSIISKGLPWVVGSYFLFRAVGVFAGENTAIYIDVQLLATLRADKWFFYMVAGMCAASFRGERKKTQKLERELADYIQQLKKRITTRCDRNGKENWL